jgi:hypothetical protein
MNCQDSLILSLDIANSTIHSGTNMTFTLTIQNYLDIPNQVNVTSFPLLPSGVDPNSDAYSRDMLPSFPPCGLTPFNDYDPAFVMVYNSSGSPVTLTNPAIPGLVSCLYGGPPTYHFGPSQALSETFTVGGYRITGRQTSALTPISGYVQFNPGKYTIVAFDAFGDSVILPFTVTASPK